MAVLWWDSFDVYGTTVALLQKWWSAAGATGLSLVTGAFAGSRAVSSVGAITQHSSPTFANTSVIGLSFWFRPGATGSDSSGFFLGIMDGITSQITLSIDANRKISIKRGATVLATSAIAPSAGVWYHLELKATIHATTGQLELRINGSAVDGIPQTAANLDTNQTANNHANAITLLSNIAAVTWAIDDLFVWDTGGSAPRNDFFGPCRVQRVFPIGAGDAAQWAVTGAGSGQEATNNDPPDAAQYISTSTSNDVSSFAHTALDAGPTVKCAMLRSSAQDPSGSAAQYKNRMYDNSTERLGAVIAPGIADAYKGDIFPQDSAGAEWTIASLNAANIGVKKS